MNKKRLNFPCVKQLLVLFVGFYVIFSALIFFRKSKMTKITLKEYQTRLEKTHFYPETTFVQYGQNCYKNHPNKTYKICSELPFTKIRCGPFYSKNKTSSKKPFLVPDVVFFVWFGDSLRFNFFNYLAIRSAAAIHQPESIDFYYSISLPTGKHWERVLSEIPCIKIKRILEPNDIAGRKIPHAVQRTDVARLRILMRYGGIYIDGDAITLKSLDPLRLYPATVGRATRDNVCICIAMSRKNSLFLREYYKHIIFNLPNEDSALLPMFTRFLGNFVKDTLVKVHIEESSMNRPNPYVPHDGKFGTTLRRMNISNNYFLHLHTGSLYRNQELGPTWIDWEEEILRKLDGVYGEAARIALFGSPDLIFKPGEEVFEQEQQIDIIQFPPVVQKNAILEDEDEYDNEGQFYEDKANQKNKNKKWKS